MKNNIYIKIAVVGFALGIIIFILSYFLQNKLPNPKKIDSSLSQEPIQGKIELDPITKAFEGVNYQITPQYSYELWGLVVSENDNEVWYSRFKDSDPLNTKDFCVIWGENVKNGNFQKIKFKTEEFVCLYSYGSEIKFNQNQLSNNHLLPMSDEIYQKIRNAHIGDQIHSKGYLISYKAIDKNGQEMTRSTSTARTDSGQGACETIYVIDFENIKPNASNTIFRYLNIISRDSIFVLLLLIIFLFLYNFFKPTKTIKKETGFVARNKKYKNLLPPSVGKDLK